MKTYRSDMDTQEPVIAESSASSVVTRDPSWGYSSTQRPVIVEKSSAGSKSAYPTLQKNKAEDLKDWLVTAAGLARTPVRDNAAPAPRWRPEWDDFLENSDEEDLPSALPPNNKDQPEDDVAHLGLSVFGVDTNWLGHYEAADLLRVKVGT